MFHYFKTRIEQFDLFFPLRTYFFFKNEIILIIPQNFFLFSCFFLNKQSYYQCKLLSGISAVDYIDRFNRFEINYDLLSIQYNFRLRLKIYSTELSTVFYSICSIYKNATWWEREIWDLYGLYFKNNFDLRRLLTDYGFHGFPLRKDFPVFGFFELSYNFFKKSCFYEGIEQSQISKDLFINGNWF